MDAFTRLLGLGVAVVTLDQLTKLAAAGWTSNDLDGSTAWSYGMLSITPVANGGAIGGVGVGRPDLLPAAAVVAVVLLLALSRRLTAGSPFGAAIALAGAAGNFIDRVRVGHVIDFLALDLGPAQIVLNLADVALFIGLPMLVMAARAANGHSPSTGMGRYPDSRLPAAGGS